MATSHEKFKTWVQTHAPYLDHLFDWEEKTCETDLVQEYLGVASHGQALVCRFAVGVWFGRNQEHFDFIEAAGVLDQDQRLAIANWFMSPVWP